MTDQSHINIDELNEVSQTYPVIFFDGVCGLCHGFVERAISSDSQKKLRFATLQSELGKQVSKKAGIEEDLSTVIAMYKGDIYVKSEVMILMSSILGGSWAPAKMLRIVPSFLRDRVYNLIAKYRYQLGHEKDSCPAPPHDWKEWFVLH